MSTTRNALQRALRLFDEALPKFNWARSALDANAVQLLNEVPGEVRAALEVLDEPEVPWLLDQYAAVRECKATDPELLARFFADLRHWCTDHKVDMYAALDESYVTYVAERQELSS